MFFQYFLCLLGSPCALRCLTRLLMGSSSHFPGCEMLSTIVTIGHITLPVHPLSPPTNHPCDCAAAFHSLSLGSPSPTSVSCTANCYQITPSPLHLTFSERTPSSFIRPVWVVSFPVWLKGRGSNLPPLFLSHGNVSNPTNCWSLPSPTT